MKHSDTPKTGRDSFASRWGFILACIGSAVGMGNIWLFPARVAAYGGGTFLIPYLLFVLLIGSTGVIGEMSFGRAAGAGPVDAFGMATERRLGKKTPGRALGLIPVLGSLALAIGYAVGEQGYSVCYETAASLFSKLERARFSHSEEAMEQSEKIETCDLLIIDDLGTEMPGQFVTAALYGLLNQRLLEGKPMVITTNLNVDETAKRYSPQVASRLYGEFSRLTFLGSDIRVLKNGGSL